MDLELRTPSPSDADFLLRASRIPDIVAATYLPRFDDELSAVAWIRGASEVQLIVQRGTPCGAIAVHSKVNTGGAEIDLPPGTGEIEIWLLPEARGSGVAMAAHGELIVSLRDLAHLVAIVWATNQSSIHLFSRLGYSPLQSIQWIGPDGAGECWVGIRHLGEGHTTI